MPRVSVIVPCHNGADYLAESIQSILDQTYTNFEIIVVDDGSTDTSAEIVASFHDPRIRYIYQENQGAASARNMGIRFSNSEFISFLDADDLYYPNKLELQVSFLDENAEIGVVAGGIAYIDSRGKLLREIESWKWSPSLGLRDWLMSCLLPIHAALLRRDWLTEGRLFDESFKASEDWDFWLRLSRAGCPMDWTEYIVAKYRMHEDSMSGNVKRLTEKHLQTLDKFFADLSLPNAIINVKALAYARVHIRSAATAYSIRDFELAKCEITQALEIEPSVLSGNPSMVVQILRWRAHHVTVPDAVDYLKAVQKNLPIGSHRLRRQIRIVIANEYIDRAFNAHQKGLSNEVIYYIKAGFREYPFCLRSRGIISIGVRAFLGSRIVDPHVRA